MDKIGDIKLIKRFAFFPKKIGKRYIETEKIWLKSYIEIWQYEHRRYKKKVYSKLYSEDGKVINHPLAKILQNFEDVEEDKWVFKRTEKI